MDDARAHGKLLYIAGNAVIEAGAYGYKQIGVVDGVVGIGCAVHAQHADAKRMGLVYGALAHQSGGYKDVGFFGKGRYFRLCTRGYGTSTNVEHGALRFSDELSRFSQLHLRHPGMGADRLI